MATTFTHKLKNFFDNNTPGGYIQTSINITDSELDARINQKFQNQNYLTSTSMIPASQITGLSTVATSGRYSDLIGITGTNVSISNTLTEGTRLATITINGVSTDIYGITPVETPAGITEEIDPIFSNSPAAKITLENISSWDNKSDFDGEYNSLNHIPNFSLIATSGSYNDLNNKPIIILNLMSFNNSNITAQEHENLYSLKRNSYILNYDEYINLSEETLEEVLLSSINKYLTSNSLFYILTSQGKYLVSNINIQVDNNNTVLYYTLSLSFINNTNYNDIRYQGSLSTFDSTIADNILSSLLLETEHKVVIIDTEYKVIFIQTIKY